MDIKKLLMGGITGGVTIFSVGLADLWNVINGFYDTNIRALPVISGKLNPIFCI